MEQTLARDLELKEQGFYPNIFNVRGENFDVQRYFREWKKLYIKDGILYKGPLWMKRK